VRVVNSDHIAGIDCGAEVLIVMGARRGGRRVRFGLRGSVADVTIVELMPRLLPIGEKGFEGVGKIFPQAGSRHRSG
jgi:hypothetical protein